MVGKTLLRGAKEIRGKILEIKPKRIWDLSILSLMKQIFLLQDDAFHAQKFCFLTKHHLFYVPSLGTKIPVLSNNQNKTE